MPDRHDPDSRPPERRLLEELFDAAVAAALPGPALAAALDDLPAGPVRAPHLLALGKAGASMARAAVDWLAARGRAPAGGVIVAPGAEPSPHAALPLVVGEHPVPAAGSLAAAEALEAAVAAVAPGDEAWVLLSGGATALLAAPEAGAEFDQPALGELYRLLLGSGLDIVAMNEVRKRFSRWGGGKLARALHHRGAAATRVFIVSDVIGDRLEAIASGPCVPDPASAGDVERRLAAAGLLHRLPDPLRHHLGRAVAGDLPETPKPGDASFAAVTTRVIVSNRVSLEAMARAARARGLAVELHPDPVEGEASDVGRRTAADLLERQRRGWRGVLLWGGETTVTLGDHPGVGGRNQELALAAAELLAGPPGGSWLLSAGTDGRDGPSDAAGAAVGPGTWAAIAAAGGDPGGALARHDAFPALALASATIPARITGTNVMDVGAGLVGGAA